MNLERSPGLDVLTKDAAYAGRVLQAIARVAGAGTPYQALQVLEESKSLMGVDQAVFVSFVQEEDAHENYRFMLAADPRWCFEYQAKAWYGSDPWLLYASMNSDPTCASRIEALTAEQREIQMLAERYGMVSVCIAPAASPGGNARVGMLALGSPQKGFFECEAFAVFKMLARSLAHELHAWWNKYERAELLRRLQITDYELQLLRLEQQRVTSKRAARMLGVSHAAIESRWYRLNRKLGSPQRQVSTRVAIRYGLI